MTMRALLLNATYEPMRVVPWQRAVTMLYLGKVEVVKNHEGHVVRAATWRVELPSVIRLIEFVRRNRVRIAFSRKNIFLRDGHRCQYCHRTFPPGELTCDHVLPRSRGGKASWDNLVAACGPCNRKKANKTPEQARMTLRKKPRRPDSLPGLGFRLGSGDAPPAWHEYLAWHAAAVAAS